MKRVLAMLSFAMLAALCAPSAQAACGGGGYKPAASATQTAPAPQSGYANQQSNYSTQQSSYSAATPANYRSNGAPTASFDASFFHRISGKLRLNYDQSTRIIAALNDIRREIDAGQKVDGRQEFEKRLQTILDPQQMKDYQTYKS